jgi:hypothetical protein
VSFGTTLIAPRLGRWREAGLGADEMSRRAPALARLISRARRVTSPPCGLDRLLRQSLDYPAESLPWAESLRRQRQIGQRPGCLLRFRLIHLRADISNALAQPLPLDARETSRLINDLNDEFKADSSWLECTPGDGLLWLTAVEPPVALPHVRDILGQPLAAWAELQRSHRDWFRLHNEMQMFLHLHPVNRRREQQGRPLINGLWCWGQGACRMADPVVEGFSEDEEIHALLACCSGSVRGLDELGVASGSARRLVVWSGWLDGLQQAGGVSPGAALAEFDERVMRPLLASRQPVRLLTGDGVDLYYRPADRFRFWRRRADWSSLEHRA